MGINLVENQCLSRQTIYDSDLGVFGYELLHSYQAPIGEAERPALTLATALADIGLDRIVGERLAWVSLGTALVPDDLAEVLPPERAVVELPRTMVASPSALEAISRIRAAGYRVAVDHAFFQPELQTSADLVDIVRVDVRDRSDEELEDVTRPLREQGVQLLAGGVATYHVLELCRGLGFTLFQGSFFETPRTLSDRRVSAEATVRMQLAAKLNDVEADFDELAVLIAADVTLSYRLLRYLNSAHVGLRRPVTSLREALVALGINGVRTWATLLLLSDAGTGRHQLVSLSLLRARMCRVLSEAVAPGSEDRAFLVGLLSVVDALVDRPLAEVIEEIAIDDEVKRALLEHEGPLGDLLQRVIAFERGDFTTATAAPLDSRSATNAYVEAIGWSTAVVGSLAA